MPILCAFARCRGPRVVSLIVNGREVRNDRDMGQGAEDPREQGSEGVVEIRGMANGRSLGRDHHVLVVSDFPFRRHTGLGAVYPWRRRRRLACQLPT